MRERVCFTLQIQPGKIAEYRERHEQAWAELHAALRAAGRNNYSVFVRDDGLVVGTYEVADRAASARLLATDPTFARWTEAMRPLLVDAPPELLTETFRLREQDLPHATPEEKRRAHH